MKDKKIEIRDIRGKERFVVDNDYIDNFAKICGAFATCVYMSLCRHANKIQSCWPSIQTLAEEHGVGITSVKKGLAKLIDHKIIEKERVGKKCNNRYLLLDKKHWVIAPIDLSTKQNNEEKPKQKKDDGSEGPVASEVVDVTQLSQVGSDSCHTSIKKDECKSPHDCQVVATRPSLGRHTSIHSKETNSKETKVSICGASSTEKEEFDFDDYLKKMIEDKRKHVQIIGLYAKAKKVIWENKEQAKSYIERNAIAASKLKGYGFERIIEVMKWLITLESVGKYIDEDLSNIKNPDKKQSTNQSEPMFLHDGNRAVRKNGRWVLYNDSSVVIDLSYYPELTKI